MSRRNNITVTLAPETLEHGQYLQLAVSITDLQGRPSKAKITYIQIIDDKGFQAWPLSVISKNTDSFVKLISTADLKADTRYTIRISTNNKQTYQNTSTFKVKKKSGLLPLVLLPFLLSPQLLRDRKTRTPSDDTKKEYEEEDTNQQEKQRQETDKKKLDEVNKKDIIEPKAPVKRNTKYDYLIYRTELDQRVCNICLGFEGRRFLYGDTDIIRIGPPEYGGQTHQGCRCHYDIIGLKDNPAAIKAKEMYLVAVLANAQ